MLMKCSIQLYRFGIKYNVSILEVNFNINKQFDPGTVSALTECRWKVLSFKEKKCFKAIHKLNEKR